MESMKERILYLFESAASIIETIPPYKRRNIDIAEIVCVDIVNGKRKSRVVSGIFDILEALKDDSKPVGLLLSSWTDPEEIQVKEFPSLIAEEQETLMHAFAETQDAQQSMREDED